MTEETRRPVPMGEWYGHEHEGRRVEFGVRSRTRDAEGVVTVAYSCPECDVLTYHVQTPPEGGSFARTVERTG